MKVCTNCGVEQPLDQFEPVYPKSHLTETKQCLSCRKARQKWYEQNERARRQTATEEASA